MFIRLKLDMETVKSRCKVPVLSCFLMLALYIYGVFSASFIPEHIEEVVLPLDFMVGIPLGFYFLVARPKRLSLLSVIPVIWLGYGLCVFALVSPSAGILPYLLCVLVPVELSIAIRECSRIAKIYRSAKTESADPLAWFRDVMVYLVRKDVVANMAAAELGVWYYALFSWRKKPYVLPGESAFGYFGAGGYANMMLGLALAFPIEIIAVHILISQWNNVVAIIVTALSLYAAVWLFGDARARAMRPVALGEEELRLECGIQMEAVIPLSDIDGVFLSQSDISHFEKKEILNYGVFYQANIWIATKRPIKIRTMLGEKSARAIGLSLDDPNSYATELRHASAGIECK